MGRITVFALEECPHCKRAKGALKARNIPYTEISLTTHPNRRNDMLSLSDRLTVPQFFFNDRHIGGADEVLAVMKEWEEDAAKKDQTPLEIYQAEIASHPDPTDERFRISTEPPLLPKAAPPRPESDKIFLPEGSQGSVLDVMERLKEALPHAKLPYKLKIYRNCFTGAACVDALMKHYDCTKEDAVALGRRLEQRQLLHHVVHEHDFSNTKDYYFRLQCHQCPDVLNSYRVWDLQSPEGPMEDPVALATRLKKLLGKVESAVTNDQGDVDYKAAKSHELFPVFEEGVCEIQRVDLALLERNEKLAFCINLYNIMIKYAFIKVGIPTSNVSRAFFFTGVKFNIGGHLYSFQDLENGILRGNRRAPYAMSKPLKGNDPRYGFALKPEEVDERIHFALNCGAKSCPPVKSFTANGIEEELRIVAQAFSEDDGNCLVDVKNRKLYLSKILSWYIADFGNSQDNLAAKVSEYLRGEKKEKLQSLIDHSNEAVSVSFFDYDWGTNASDFQEFNSCELQAQYYSVKALW